VKSVFPFSLFPTLRKELEEMDHPEGYDKSDLIQAAAQGMEQGQQQLGRILERVFHPAPDSEVDVESLSYTASALGLSLPAALFQRYNRDLEQTLEGLDYLDNHTTSTDSKRFLQRLVDDLDRMGDLESLNMLHHNVPYIQEQLFYLMQGRPTFGHYVLEMLYFNDKTLDAIRNPALLKAAIATLDDAARAYYFSTHEVKTPPYFLEQIYPFYLNNDANYMQSQHAFEEYFQIMGPLNEQIELVLATWEYRFPAKGLPPVDGEPISTLARRKDSESELLNLVIVSLNLDYAQQLKRMGIEPSGAQLREFLDMVPTHGFLQIRREAMERYWA
jgi:hypothetical protein